MNRVISDIDGFNLYFGLKEKSWRRYYWSTAWSFGVYGVMG